MVHAHAKVWKYVSKHMDLSKQTKILDPTQMGTLLPHLDAFPPIFSLDLQCALVDGGE